MLVLEMVFDTKSTNNESDNRQVGLQQILKLLHSKRNNQQNEKATYRIIENIFKLHIR